MKRIVLPLVLLAVCACTSVCNAEDSLADQYNKFFSYFVGKWEFKIGDVPGTASFEKSPDAPCLVLRIKVANGTTATGIEGFDPGDQCWKYQSFGNDGSFGRAATKLDAATLKDGPIGKTYFMEGSSAMPDGTKLSEKVTITIVNQDQYKYESPEIQANVNRVK